MGEKGKYASATEGRRQVWKEIVWPLILELGEPVFTIKQYQNKRSQVCDISGMSVGAASRGLVSLVQKGILYKENAVYGIHYRLIPYMRLKADCDYATAINEIKMK